MAQFIKIKSRKQISQMPASNVSSRYMRPPNQPLTCSLILRANIINVFGFPSTKFEFFSFRSLQFCFRIDSVLSLEFGVPETDHKPDRSWERGWERIDHKVLCAIGNS